MGLRINNNLEAQNALRQLNINQMAFSKSMQRLSSGKRINSAADDAAGYAISNKLNAQAKGLDQASSNAQDGISMIQTAAGGLQTTQDMLQRLRQLAVQSANDTNTTSDRQALQGEANQISQEITQISKTTQFNTKNLLDGTFGETASASGLNAITGTLPPNVAAPTVGAGSLSAGAFTLSVTASTNPGTASQLGATSGIGAQPTGANPFLGSTKIDDQNNALLTQTGGAASTTVAGLSALGGGLAGVSSFTAGTVKADTYNFTVTAGTASATAATVGQGAANGTPAIAGATLIDDKAAGLETSTGAVSGSANVGVDTSQAGNLTFGIKDASGTTTNITLTVGETFQQVADAINQSGAKVQASVTSKGLQLTNAGAGAFSATQLQVSGNQNTLRGLGFVAADATTTSGGAVGNTSTNANGTGGAAATAVLHATGGSGQSDISLTSNGNVFTDATSGFSINLSAVTGKNVSSGVANLTVAKNYVGVNTTSNQNITLTDENGKSASYNLQAGETFTTLASDLSNLGLALKATVGNSGLVITNTGLNQAGAVKITGSDNALKGLGLVGANGSAASVNNPYTLNGNTGTAGSPATATLTGNFGQVDVSGNALNSAITLTNSNNVFSDSASGFSVDFSQVPTALLTGNATVSVASGAAQLQVGANSGQNISVNIGAMDAKTLGVQGGSPLQALDLTTQSSASAAISTIDTAIQKVSSQAASLGAVQNRLSSAMSNLAIGSENMTAAYGNITNVNMAQESTSLATAQILQQSATAMLAQANQAPQSVLKLLG